MVSYPFRLHICAVALLLSNLPAITQTYCAPIQSAKEKTYGFNPTKLDQNARTAKSAQMDAFWTLVKSYETDGVTCLRNLLVAEQSDGFFLFDGASLLYSIDKSDASVRVVVSSIERADLERERVRASAFDGAESRHRRGVHLWNDAAGRCGPLLNRGVAVSGNIRARDRCSAAGNKHDRREFHCAARFSRIDRIARELPEGNPGEPHFREVRGAENRTTIQSRAGAGIHSRTSPYPRGDGCCLPEAA